MKGFIITLICVAIGVVVFMAFQTGVFEKKTSSLVVEPNNVITWDNANIQSWDGVETIETENIEIETIEVEGITIR